MIRKIETEKDWNHQNILESILDGQSPNLHFGWIALLYKKYRLGDWHNTIPVANTIGDKTYLGWDNECYCLFHERHERFGDNIIECANPYSKNTFVFFDYEILRSAFDALDAQEQVPYIPIYYAKAEDRYDFQTSSHLWEGE